VRGRPAIWKMLAAGVVVVCLVNVGGIALTASSTPKLLRSVKTLDDLVGVDPLAVPAPIGAAAAGRPGGGDRRLDRGGLGTALGNEPER
jgi:hypothetical protein